MKILSTAKGLILIFDSLVDLHGVIEHLSGMEGWVESEDIAPPHLYAVFDDRIDKDEIENMLDEIKYENK